MDAATVSGPNHVASDSDSEVYCDSVDQFGQEEVSPILTTMLSVIAVLSALTCVSSSELGAQPLY